MQFLPLQHLQATAREVLNSTDATEIEAKLSYILRHYGLVNFEFKYELPLFRAVLCESDQGFPNVGRLGYPPAHLTRPGRLNEAGRPVLYASVNQYTPLEEIGAKSGDFVQIATFRLSPGAGIRAGIVGELTQVQRSGRAMSSDKLGTELQQLLTRIDLAAGKSFLLADAFLSSILRDSGAARIDYIRSRVLARLLFAKTSQPLDAIMYPSVAHEGAMNFAVAPESSDSKLRLSSTFVLRIKEKYDYGIYDVETVRKAHGHHGDGTINWLQ